MPTTDKIRLLYNVVDSFRTSAAIILYRFIYLEPGLELFRGQFRIFLLVLIFIVTWFFICIIYLTVSAGTGTASAAAFIIPAEVLPHVINPNRRLFICLLDMFFL